MAMPAHPTEWTVEMVRALRDDGHRYEVIDGELYVKPALETSASSSSRRVADLDEPYDIGAFARH